MYSRRYTEDEAAAVLVVSCAKRHLDRETIVAVVKSTIEQNPPVDADGRYSSFAVQQTLHDTLRAEIGKHERAAALASEREDVEAVGRALSSEEARRRDAARLTKRKEFDDLQEQTRQTLAALDAARAEIRSAWREALRPRSKTSRKVEKAAGRCVVLKRTDRSLTLFFSGSPVAKSTTIPVADAGGLSLSFSSK